MLSEISRMQKDKDDIIPLIRGTRTVEFVEIKSEMVVTKGYGEGELGNYESTGIKFQLRKMSKVQNSAVQCESTILSCLLDFC